MAESTAGHTDLDSALATEEAAFIEYLNTEVEDSTLFVARILGHRPEATKARILGVDRIGIDAEVTDPDGEHRLRIDFDIPITEAHELTTHMIGLVLKARAESGEAGLTSAERAMDEMGAIRTFLTTVHAVNEVHPHLRRITFKGGDLEGFWWPAPDTFLYVLLPPPGREELTIDQSFSWEAVGEMPAEDQPVGAYYTVREWRPATCELDVLFVLHGDEGPASAWAGRAQPGDPVALWGPRTTYAPPPSTDGLLLVADETGLPAVAVILEQAPAHWPVRVLAEIGDEEHRQPLPDRPGVDLTWLSRAGREPGTTTLLADAVRALPELAPTTYCWGGGESRAMTAVRKQLRHERGFGRAEVDMVGYWRHPDSPPEA